MRWGLVRRLRGALSPILSDKSLVQTCPAGSVVVIYSNRFSFLCGDFAAPCGELCPKFLTSLRTTHWLPGWHGGCQVCKAGTGCCTGLLSARALAPPRNSEVPVATNSVIGPTRLPMPVVLPRYVNQRCLGTLSTCACFCCASHFPRLSFPCSQRRAASPPCGTRWLA